MKNKRRTVKDCVMRGGLYDEVFYSIGTNGGAPYKIIRVEEEFLNDGREDALAKIIFIEDNRYEKRRLVECFDDITASPEEIRGFLSKS